MTNDSSGNKLVSLLKDTLTSLVSSDYPDLTARQMAILLNCHMASEPQTVRGLAAKLSISKPAVTRALNRLQDDQMIRRAVDADDRRSVLVSVCGPGVEFTNQMARMMSEAHRGNISPARLVSFMHGTMDAIVSRTDKDMTWRQLAVLLICYLTKEAQTVRGLAARLKISKPAVTRAVDKLEELNLAERLEDSSDGRSVLIGRTAKGDNFVERLRVITADAYAASSRSRQGSKAHGHETSLAA